MSAFYRAYRLDKVAILAMQVREQEHQRKRERPDNCSNPRPDFERASPTLSNSTGKVPLAMLRLCWGPLLKLRWRFALRIELVARGTGRQDPLKCQTKTTVMSACST